MESYIKPLIKAFEHGIKLIQIRNNRKSKHYNQFVEVCYENAKIVRDDFISIFKENDRLLKEKQSIKQAILHIEEQRQLTLSNRDFLRANLWSVDESEFTEFEIGVSRLVLGNNLHALMRNHEMLKALVDRISRQDYDEEEINRSISHALFLNDDSREIVEKSWKLINTGYAKYKKEYLNL